VLRCLSEYFFALDYTADRFWKSCGNCLTERSEGVLTQPNIGSMAPPVQKSHERKHCSTKYGNILI